MTWNVSLPADIGAAVAQLNTDVAGGLFGVAVVVTVFVISLVLSRAVKITHALPAASFVTTLAAVFLVNIGALYAEYLLALIIMTAISAVFAWRSSSTLEF